VLIDGFEHLSAWLALLKSALGAANPVRRDVLFLIYEDRRHVRGPIALTSIQNNSGLAQGLASRCAAG